MTLSRTWLPTGNHWGLIIDHHPVPDAGAFIDAKPRIVLHTTEGDGFDAMARVLDAENYEPNLLISPTAGPSHVRQFVALNRASKALEHPAGTVDTNRMHAIQIEIAGYAGRAHDWADWFYRDLGALCALIEHRAKVQHVGPGHPFTGGNVHPERMSDAKWRTFNGYCGHQHVPHQPSGHWDPGAMDLDRLFHWISEANRTYA